ncbi:MAG TPA: sigma-70 family RNA polymerase sigma factor [Abditibacteriaceae bacterium]|jgi:RNA polymerase sigma-70 factor (ECF subfamily)
MARNELQLMQRIAQGDGTAHAQFVDDYGARVHRLVRQNIADTSDAEDVTQEIFVDLFRSSASFRGEAALSTWVYRVALHHCWRWRERTSGKPIHSNCDEESIEPADAAPGPDCWLMQRELSSQVRSAIGELSPVQRDAVVLHELHGLTYAQCAAILDVPVGTVKSRLSNAFRALRISLNDYVLGDESAARAEWQPEGAV